MLSLLLRFHLDKADERCHLCDFACFTPLALKIHLRREHHYRKPRVDQGKFDAARHERCPHCDSFFSQKSGNLNVHLKKFHPHKADHRCAICAFSCFAEATFKRHQFKEHGIRPEKKPADEAAPPPRPRDLQCQHCPAQFPAADKSKLLRHVQRNHPETIAFDCDACEFKGVSQLELIMHRQNYH